MRNLALEKLKNNENLLGSFISVASSDSMECIGETGLDFVIIDTEHGPYVSEHAKSLMVAAELHGMTPFVRVSGGNRSNILTMLDNGAHGLIIPDVHTVEEVKSIVRYGKYVPVGQRGFSYGRGAKWGADESCSAMETYCAMANRESLLFPQCETLGALEHIEEIAAIDGVDGIFIGPFDLSIAMGIPGQFDKPEFQAALDRIVKACKDNNKYSMIYAPTASGAAAHFARGIESVAVGIDAIFLMDAYKAMVKSIKG